MMKKSIIYTFIMLLFACIQPLIAQSSENRQLEYIYGLFPSGCTLPAISGTFECKDVSSIPLKIRYGINNEITHLGIDLFREEVREALGYMICDFQERLFLELLLLRSNEKIKQQLAEYKIKIHYQNTLSNSLFNSLENILKYIKIEATEYILIKDSLTWTASWKEKIDLFSFTFPADYTLISGMDKKEAEDHFEKQIKNYNCQLLHPFVIDMEEFNEVYDGIYVKHGKAFFLKDINSNIYVKKEGSNNYSLIFDREYPKESISNLFSHIDKKTEDLMVKINHKAYGNQIKTYDISLYEFLCYLDDEFEPYVGIEKINQKEAKFTVIFKNKQYNYHHLLYIESSLDSIFLKKGVMKGTLYTYIPNANIKNLYKEMVPNRKISIEFNIEE